MRDDFHRAALESRMYSMTSRRLLHRKSILDRHAAVSPGAWCTWLDHALYHYQVVSTCSPTVVHPSDTLTRYHE